MQETSEELISQFEKLVNTRVAAPFIGVHYKTLEQMARTGQVPAAKFGKSWMFRVSVLNKWLDKQLELNVASDDRR